MPGEVNENEMANIRHAVPGEGAGWSRAGCAGSCDTELRTGSAQGQPGDKLPE